MTPFCRETTKPSGASRGAIASSAAAVCWDFTASSTAPSPSGSSLAETAGTRAVNCSTGPSIVSPCSLIGGDMLGICVAEQHVVPVSGEPRADRPSDRPGTYDDVLQLHATLIVEAVLV